MTKGNILQLALASLTSVMALAALKAMPQPGERAFVVVFPPWTSEAAAIGLVVAAGGHLLRFRGAGFIAAVVADDEGYAARIRERGAWLVASSRIARGCGS